MLNAAAAEEPEGAAPGRPLPPVNPILISSDAELAAALPRILAAPVVALDTETTGLDPFDHRLCLVQLGTSGAEWLIDVRPGRVDPRLIQPVLDGAPRIAGHNLKFDLRMLDAAGLELPSDLGARLADTMILSHLLWAGEGTLHHKLADVTDRVLGVHLDKSEQVSDWSAELSDAQIRYAAMDVAVMPALLDGLDRVIGAAGLDRVAEIEHRALPALAWLENAGLPFVKEPWLELAGVAEARRRDLEERLDALVPADPDQSSDETEAEPTSRWSRAADVRRILAGRGLDLRNTQDSALREHVDDPVVGLLLRYRQAERLTGAFGAAFTDHVHPLTGRIHASYQQISSRSGRLACHSPSVQWVPRDPAYRACVRAPEGRVLISGRLRQIELRIAAELAGDEALIEAFQNGENPHTRTARSLAGGDRLTLEDRRRAQACNYGLLSGMAAEDLQRYAWDRHRVEMTVEQAREYRERFFDAHPGLRRWQEGQPDGPIDTRTPAGRRLLHVEARAEKLNAPLQGTGADGMKTALGLLWERRRPDLDAVPVLVGRDEILIEAPAARAREAAAWLREAMVDGMGSHLPRVPVEADLTTGRDWTISLPARGLGARPRSMSDPARLDSPATPDPEAAEQGVGLG